MRNSLEQAVIVFFGDHQPHLPDSFYFQMTGKIPARFYKEEALKKIRDTVSYLGEL